MSYTNNEQNMLPPDMRKWVIEQMVAINLEALPAELVDMFLTLSQESLEKGWGDEMARCLSEAKKITDRLREP